jgi:hypothetical protein
MTLLHTIHLRCPSCRSIDWFRDGFVIVKLEATGDIVRRRVMSSDPILARGPWACARCAYQVPVPSNLALELHRAKVVHPE